MKILYAVQATGNGHISRALELLPYLKRYGKVDIFLSGSNSHLQGLQPALKSRGISLHYTARGGLNYLKTVKELQLQRIYSESKTLPVEKYDIVLNDFEFITSLACRIKKIPFLHVGHQASFASAKTPRPQHKSLIGEFILKNYCRSVYNFGFHFQAYDSFVSRPIIKRAILESKPVNKEHITVYLPQYSDAFLVKLFSNIRHRKFHIFSKFKKNIIGIDNITFYPIDNKTFNKSFIECDGIITGAGFETPAEALYLNKKLICIPIGGQYEQLCNAVSLKTFGVITENKLDLKTFPGVFEYWIDNTQQQSLYLNETTEVTADKIMDAAANIYTSANMYYYKELMLQRSSMDVSVY